MMFAYYFVSGIVVFVYLINSVVLFGFSMVWFCFLLLMLGLCLFVTLCSFVCFCGLVCWLGFAC